MTEDDAFLHWLAGFIDGEGCFDLCVYTEKPNVAPRMRVALRADDAAILREILRRTGLGTIRSYARPGENENDVCSWEVFSRKQCLELVSILDDHPLRAKKANDLAIWRKAVIHWQGMPLRGNRWSGCSDWSYMSALAAELRAGKKFDVEFAHPHVESPYQQLKMAG